MRRSVRSKAIVTLLASGTVIALTTSALAETFAISVSCVRYDRSIAAVMGYLSRKPRVKVPPPTVIPDPSTCSGVSLTPANSLASAISANPEGTTFCLSTGVYRTEVGLYPKKGQSFIGAEGAVVNGSKILTSFSQQGSTWVAFGQIPTTSPSLHGSCAPSTYQGCKYANAVFLDDAPLWRVMTLAEVTPGKFFMDYSTNAIYVADDPTGRKLEVATARGAFRGPAANVTIRGLAVEKFANNAQKGAIDSAGGSGWVIENNKVRLNHGVGICGDTDAQVRGNFVHDQGQLGLCGHGSNGLYENNEIARNNTAGFSLNWEGGGSKWARTSNLIVRGNYSHDNIGPGLWTDIDNIHTLYENNRVENNSHAGIFHEISYDAIIRGNTVIGNGFARGDWLWGAGILIAASPNVDVHSNLLEGNANGIALIQQSRGIGAYGPHEMQNIDVHNNSVSMTVGMTGLVQDVSDTSYFTSRNIHFDSNTYYLGPNLRYFAWMNGPRTTPQWVSYGNDTVGTFLGL